MCPLNRILRRPVFIRRQYMQHRFSLDARTSHILLCHCAHGLSVKPDTSDLGESKNGPLFRILLKRVSLVPCIVAWLDCIDVYGMPGAKGDISTHPDNRRHDFSNLRQIIDFWLRTSGEDLSVQPSDLRRRAERTIHRMKQELVPDWSFADSYTARPHRCSCFICECSGMKAPHKLRICKGCLSVFYCNKLCQER